MIMNVLMFYRSGIIAKSTVLLSKLRDDTRFSTTHALPSFDVRMSKRVVPRARGGAAPHAGRAAS